MFWRSLRRAWQFLEPAYAALVSFIIIFLAASAWVTGAMVVAFPQHMLNLHFQQMFTDFLASGWHPGSLGFLLLADIAIAIGLLNDIRMKESLMIRPRVAAVLACMIVFILITMAMPEYGKDLLLAHPVPLGLLTLLVVAVPRGISYAPPARARAV
ncbi:MAG TPA: hypothetical protein VD906_13165 [Caulobacteraceae bacterium]|nr:hypothetical protein [Caulobacteraceae bacterium]